MEELLQYYSNLLIVQYNGKPRAKATIDLFTYLIFVNLVILAIQNAFDWRTAVGAQLDIIGKWVGVSRDYNGTPFWSNEFFSYPRSADLYPTDLTDTLQHGYSDYSTYNDDGAVLTYDQLGYIEQTLNDDDYRTVIGLKIIKNSINHTAKNIDDAIWDYFGGDVYTTWDVPHRVTYHHPPELSNIMNVCEYKEVLPAPTGVKIILKEE